MIYCIYAIITIIVGINLWQQFLLYLYGARSDVMMLAADEYDGMDLLGDVAGLPTRDDTCHPRGSER